MKHLLIKGAGGLGDRILGAATGLLYAQITGRRPIVDWRDLRYSDDGSNSFVGYFDAPGVGDVDELSPTASVAPGLWRGRLDQRVMTVREDFAPPGKGHASWQSTCVDLTRTDHPEDLLVVWSHRQRIEWLRPHMRGEFAPLARMDTDAILKHVMETSMPLRPEIAERVAAFRRERLQGPTVGVHARYTDRRTQLETIRRRLERILAKQNGVKVFLATDNAAVQEEFERAYGAITVPKWYGEPGVALHWSPDRDAFEVGVEALVDLYVLARCDRLIGDRDSNFSRIAMLLAGASPVVDIQSWKKRWPTPVRALWRHVVPGPAAPLAVAAARRWAH